MARSLFGPIVIDVLSRNSSCTEPADVVWMRSRWAIDWPMTMVREPPPPRACAAGLTAAAVPTCWASAEGAPQGSDREQSGGRGLHSNALHSSIPDFPAFAANASGGENAAAATTAAARDYHGTANVADRIVVVDQISSGHGHAATLLPVSGGADWGRNDLPASGRRGCAPGERPLQVDSRDLVRTRCIPDFKISCGRIGGDLARAARKDAAGKIAGARDENVTPHFANRTVGAAEEVSDHDHVAPAAGQRGAEEARIAAVQLKRSRNS